MTRPRGQDDRADRDEDRGERSDDPLFQRLREGIAVATFDDGGLLLHFASGDVFQLGPAAVPVWRAIAASERMDDAIARLQSSAAASFEEARALVEAAIAQARALGARRPPQAFRIEDDALSVSLWKHERPLLAFDRRTSALALKHRPDPARPVEEDDVAALIRLFVPKVLARWFPLAIHASALAVGGRAVLFAGASGAGKTTTARALAEGLDGAILLSEDIVLFARVGAESTILDGAEAIVRAWIDDVARALAASPATPADVTPLGEALARRPERTPLGKIVFLDAARRLGSAWSFNELGRAEALRALFLNSFLPSAAPQALRSHLAACREVASGARAQEAATIPTGLDDLRASGRRQSETIAS